MTAREANVTDTGAGWVEVGAVGDIGREDVIRFDHGEVAIYRSPDDKYYATDGIRTHEHAHLLDGLMLEHFIECPKHNGRFDYRTGAAMGTPVCVDLKTYPMRVEDGRVFVKLG
jgi:3-phenylpropionate/trans-cinnamate dioxygenase ferredoxin subunit